MLTLEGDETKNCHNNSKTKKQKQNKINLSAIVFIHLCGWNRSQYLKGPKSSKLETVVTFVIEAIVLTNLDDAVEEVSRETQSPYCHTCCHNYLTKAERLRTKQKQECTMKMTKIKFKIEIIMPLLEEHLF